MTTTDERIREEEVAIHRTRGTVTEVVEQLKAFGLHEMAPWPGGKPKRVSLDRDQRRSLLVFLSELEEHVKTLEDFTADLARAIEQTNRNMAAASAYRSTGQSVRKFSRRGRH
jgi:hypothetical protein